MRTYVFVAVLVCLTAAAFLPGVRGDFLFDDFANLPALGAYGPVDNLRTFLLYLTSGHADPTGRPLSLLTFLIDARTWPADPLSFKITNLLIHLLNAVLLFVLIRRLEHRVAPSSATAANWPAFFGAALWAAHPLMLSTALYIVQRETMLSALFILAGLHLWLSARQRFDSGDARGWRWAFAAAVGCTALAVLCKANGALLPLLIWIVDALILRQPTMSSSLRWARRLLLMLPSAALVGYLVATIPASASAAVELRPWTLSERVLSQPAILLDYLKLLLLPRAMTAGLFQDGAHVASSLTAPTIAAIAFWAALATLAWLLRRRVPLLSLAVLFFLGGHLMESTVIPLELYFEHRNYVPALLLFWPLAHWLGSASPRARITRAAGVAIVILLAVVTHLGARVWGDTDRLAAAWATLAPDSARAQTYAARRDTARGDYAAAEQRLLRMLARKPQEIQVAFALADLYCVTGHYDASVEARVSKALATARNDTRLSFDWLLGAVDSPRDGSCPGLELDGVERMLAALKSNERLARSPGRRQDLAYLAGRVALARGNTDAAAVAFDANLRLLTRPEVALNQAAMLGNAGAPALGLAHLQLFRSLYNRTYYPWPDMRHVHAWLLQRTHYWDAELDALQKSLTDDAAAAEKAR